MTGGRIYEVKYSRTVTYLLSSPYKTNCFDYTKTGCKSRSDCIDKRNIELSLNDFNSLPAKTNLDINNDKDALNGACKSNEFCQRKHKSPDCINQYYAIKTILHSSLKEYLDDNGYSIGLMQLNTSMFQSLDYNLITCIEIVFGDEPDTIYTHSPQQYPIEFICLIGCVISLWTGFSIMSMYGYGKGLLKGQKVKSKKSVVLVNNLYFGKKKNGKVMAVKIDSFKQKP